MEIPKPTQADRERFQSLVPNDARVEVKPMFGNLAGFVCGNMFMGLFGSDVGVKLPEGDRRGLELAGGGPFGPRERPMGGYAALPASFGPTDAKPWVEKALSYVAAMPPKTSGQKRPRA
jgi:hypothetical protein